MGGAKELHHLYGYCWLQWLVGQGLVEVEPRLGGWLASPLAVSAVSLTAAALVDSWFGSAWHQVGWFGQ
jgi:hypothetical protein